MQTQLVVIGGGPGGYAAAFLAADFTENITDSDGKVSFRIASSFDTQFQSFSMHNITDQVPMISGVTIQFDTSG